MGRPVLLAATNSAPPVLPTNGLRVRFDPPASYPGSGTLITNLGAGGAPNNGTLFTNTTYSASNGGTFLTGTTGYIQIAGMNSASAMQNVSAFSVCLFVNLKSSTSPILFLPVWSYGATGAGATTTDTLVFANNASLSFQINNGTDGGWAWSRPPVAWGCMCFTFDGTQVAAERVKYYYNGALQTPTSSSYVYPTTTSNANGGSWIGRYFSDQVSATRMDSPVGPFLFYNRAITAGEASSIFEFYRSRYSI